MSDPQAPGAWQIVEWLGAALIGVLQFIGLWQIRRIGALEDGKVNKLDFAALVDEFRAQNERADEARQRLYDKIDEAGKAINSLAIAVGRLEGRANRRGRTTDD